jgi:hypothetical protein
LGFKEFINKFETAFTFSYVEEEVSSGSVGPDENRIRRHVLDCLGVLIYMQRKRDAIECFETKVFWAAISSVGNMGANLDESDCTSSHGNIVEEILLRNFPSPAE